MAKVKFNWSLHLSQNNQELEVWLNGDVSKIIEIKNDMFYENVADFFTEAAVFQFMHGTPTNMIPNSFLQLRQAYGIHDNWEKEKE